MFNVQGSRFKKNKKISDSENGAMRLRIQSPFGHIKAIPNNGQLPFFCLGEVQSFFGETRQDESIDFS